MKKQEKQQENMASNIKSKNKMYHIKKWAKDNPIILGLHGIFMDYFNTKKSKFGYCGKDCNIIPPLHLINPKNLYLFGNNGLNHATIINLNAKFIMKKNSGSAYGLTVVTGNHAMIKGRLYRTITEDEKPIGLDQDVTVEEDVWIGCHVTLLSGVTIGRGSIVAAGAVVTKSFPPYSIIGGVPAKLIKFKWDIDDIINHEMIIYPESERYSREELVEMRMKYPC